MKKADDRQGILPFEIVEDVSETDITSYSGLLLTAEAMSALKVEESCKKHLHIKERERGYSEYDYLRSFVFLLSAGGEHLEDIEQIREDAGLRRIFKTPSSSALRFFLYQFHDEEKMKERPMEGAFVPEESEELKGLWEVNRDIVRGASEERVKKATLEADSTVIESGKEEAKWTYKKVKGYQPQIVWWVEGDKILSDEFRDGNVPSRKDVLRVVQNGIKCLPEGVEEIAFRADSAFYDHELLNWMRDGWKEEEWMKGVKKIYFAISAVMSEELKKEIMGLGEEEWKPLGGLEDEGELEGKKEWAEVEFVPSAPSTKKWMEPDRYICIRVRPYQGKLFSDGNEWRYFAIVTNIMDWEGDKVIEWQRGKCGGVEKVIDELKNGYGGGVMPCGRFGANSAWWRMNCISYNINSFLKRVALPEGWEKLRIKGLRFRVICIAGKVLNHARKLYLRLRDNLAKVVAIFIEARKKLLLWYLHTPPLKC